MAVLTMKVPDISCQGCANAIDRAVGSLQGVCDVTVDIPAKQVTVNYDENEVGPGAITERIEDAGYEVAPG